MEIYCTSEVSTEYRAIGRAVGLKNEHWDLSVLPELGACCGHMKTWHQSAWHNVLRPMPGLESDPFESGAFAMLPYVNRIYGGRLNAQGTVLTLPCNRPRVPHPVHGVGWMHAWRVSKTSAHSIQLQLDHQAHANWPYDFSAIQTWSLQESSLRWDISLTHQGMGSMPAGIGFHPFLSIDTDSTLELNAKNFLSPDAKQAPQVWQDVDASDDQKPVHQGSVAAMEINHCFAGWAESASLAHASRGFTVKLQASADLPFVSLYRPNGASWLCIEPATHANGAFSVQDQPLRRLGARYLQTQESLHAQLTISIQEVQSEIEPGN
jgi:aldose 1-epimerase